MPGIVRDKGKDQAGGQLIKGSPTVFANNKPVVRVKDNVSGHGSGPHQGPVMITGSKNVYANNKKVCRAKDQASCGHQAKGSKDVIVN
jgi:uncharacterized Zn-binding protein involved in type VI secretion